LPKTSDDETAAAEGAVFAAGAAFGADVGLGGWYGFGGRSFFGWAAGLASGAAAPRVPTLSFGLYFFRTPSL